MTRLLIFLMIITLFSCTNKNNKKTSYLAEGETFQLISNSEFEVIQDEKLYEQYLLKPGKKQVVIYENKGTTLIESENEEAYYREVLIFSFDEEKDKFEYTDKDLCKINCTYSWRAATKKLAKKLAKKVVNVEIGSVSGQKNKNG